MAALTFSEAVRLCGEDQLCQHIIAMTVGEDPEMPKQEFLTVNIPIDTARNHIAGEAGDTIDEILTDALNARADALYKAALGQSWVAVREMLTEHESWKVRCDGAIWPKNEAQARLMAGSLNLAKTCERLVKWSKQHRAIKVPDTELDEIVADATASLKEAGLK